MFERILVAARVWRITTDAIAAGREEHPWRLMRRSRSPSRSLDEFEDTVRSALYGRRSTPVERVGDPRRSKAASRYRPRIHDGPRQSLGASRSSRRE
jgi:hypothetical protein